MGIEVVGEMILDAGRLQWKQIVIFNKYQSI
jgi:hypothetical protein